MVMVTSSWKLAITEYVALAVQTAGAVITDSKGPYDSVATSQITSLGLDDSRSTIEALALRQLMAETFAQGGAFGGYVRRRNS